MGSPSHIGLWVCVVLAGILVESHAVSSYVGAQYLSGYGDLTTSLSCYTAGISSAFSQTVGVGPVSYSPSIVAVASANGYSTYTSFSQRANFLAMFGPSGRLLLVNINSNIGTSAFMNFAPFVQVQSSTTALCRYQDQVYWTLPTTQAQAVGLLFYLSLRDLYPLNQLSIRTSKEYVGESVQKIMGVVPKALGVKMTRQMYGSGSTVTFISTNNVGIVYQNTQTDNNAAEVIAELITASALITLNTTVATTVELAYMTLQVYKSKSSSKVIPPENIIISMPVPGLEATEYIASQQFAQQASSSFGTLSMLQKNLMMAGWASGHALVTAMNKYTGVTLNNKANFFNNLLAAQSSFLVGDLFIGSFGSSVCPSSSAVQQGALCNCHAGGNNIWFQSLTKSGTSFDTTSLLGGQFQYGLGMCANLRADNDDSLTTPNTAAEILDVPRTVHLVGLSPSDDEMVSDLCSQAHSTINRLANTSLYWHHSSHAVRGYCQKTTLGSASTDLTTHKASYVTTSLMGVIPDGISNAVTPPFSLVIDVMPQTTQPRISVANYVYLFPTLEQELSVLASYLAGVVTDTSAVCGVVRSSSSSAATASIISTTMSVFGINVPSAHLQQPTNNLAANIPVGCTHTVVIGIAESDAAGLLAYLKSHPTNVLLVSFDDVTKFYASIYSAFHAEDVSVTGRLVFATNLPSWTGPSLSATELSSAKTLSTVPEFVQTLSPTEQTPAAVRTFLAAMLYDQLTMGTRWGQSDLAAALYGNVTVRVAGMTFGPFTKTWGGASQNLMNYGAQDIAVWSFTRVTDASTGLLAPPRTPSLDISVASRAMNPDAVSKLVLAVGQNAGARDAEECFELQASSSNSKGPASSEKSESSLPTIDPLSSSFSTSSASATSSSASGSLWTVVYVLVALLVVVLLYIIILLLLWCGTVRWVVGFISSSRCCGVHPGNSSKTSAAKLRTRIDVEGREDRELQIMARDPCRAPDNSHDSLTFVFVEVEHWRLLWVRQAEVMSRSVRYYNRCLRLTAVELQCYEMESVEGMFVVACPSAFTGLQFARTVVEKVAELTASDADILAAEYKIFGCGNGPAGGLRVRAAIHSGLAMRKVGASGRVKWTGTTVVGVITSAYIAGKAGMIVLTRSATRAIESTNANVGTLQSAGVYSLTPNMEEELLLLEVLPSSDTALDGAGKRDVDSTYAVRMLGKSDNCEDGATCAMCVAMLDEHYADISERERIYDLQWISQRCGLLSPDMCAAQHVYYQALQASVCRHLAALLECRLGVPRAVRMRSQLSITGSSRRPSQWNSREVSAQAARKALRKTSKRRLFFAYSRHGDGD